MSVRNILEVVCNKRQLVLSDHFLRIRANTLSEFVVPQLTDLINELVRLILSRHVVI